MQLTPRMLAGRLWQPAPGAKIAPGQEESRGSSHLQASPELCPFQQGKSSLPRSAVLRNTSFSNCCIILERRRKKKGLFWAIFRVIKQRGMNTWQKDRKNNRLLPRKCSKLMARRCVAPGDSSSHPPSKSPATKPGRAAGLGSNNPARSREDKALRFSFRVQEVSELHWQQNQAQRKVRRDLLGPK